MTARFSCHWHRVLQHFGSGVLRNQNLRHEAFRFFKFFFRLSFFSFSFLLAAVIDLLLGLLAVKKASKEASSRQWQEILL